MTTDEHDDRFDAWVREAAKEYNRPPDIPPRDAMWDAIREARAGARTPGGSTLRVSQPNRFGPRHAWWASGWSMAAAATLLLSAGVGIGYWMRDTAGSKPAVAAANPSSVNGEQPAVPTPASPVANTTRAPSTGYDVVAAQHLTSAEALLTVFRDDSGSTEATRRWARDLLSTTRLLLDSPAARDPGRKRLLSDLETILVQMVQLPAHGNALDRRLIDQTIAQEQVMTRIRTSIPAGYAGGT